MTESNEKKFSLKQWLEKHEGRLSFAFFALGFLWDNIFLTRPDSAIDHIVLLSYLFATASSIIIFNSFDPSRAHSKFARDFAAWLPYIIQFCFGGIFSASVIFYARSAALFANWPFILIIVAIFFGNEIFKKRYEILNFQITVFFAAVFSYAIFAMPVLLHRIGRDVFIYSGLASLSATWLLARFVRRFAPEKFHAKRGLRFFAIFLIYVIFNAMYFFNLIPPIPLALKDIAVYHSIVKDGNQYDVKYEAAPWYLPWEKVSGVFHKKDGEPIFVYTAVFAPTKLDATILHRWAYLDEKTLKWITTSTYGFKISGGRSAGFRGYTVKDDAAPGKWRVDVMTADAQIVGRIEFEVASAESAPALLSGVN